MVLMIKMIEVENMMWKDVNVVSEGVAIVVRVTMKKLRMCNSSLCTPCESSPKI